jgi:hypothetical protein
LGLSSIQKCIVALHILAYGVSLDATDEYCRLAKSTAMEAMKRYVKAIRAIFGGTYMRQSTHNDLVCQMDINAKQGFLGMFASIDCMH